MYNFIICIITMYVCNLYNQNEWTQIFRATEIFLEKEFILQVKSIIHEQARAQK